MNSTGTPGGSGIPAGWYDDPSGHGLRWWDGEQWTEHVHTAESAAASGGVGTTSGEREGAPPRDLVKLRERIRARGAKTVGMALGAVILVLVVIALLVSGGSDNGGGTFEPGVGGPGAGTPGTSLSPKQAARRAAIIRKRLRRQLKNGNGEAAQKALQAERKALEEAGVADPQEQIEAVEKALKSAG